MNRDTAEVICPNCGEYTIWRYAYELQGILMGDNFCNYCDIIVDETRQEIEYLEE